MHARTPLLARAAASRRDVAAVGSPHRKAGLGGNLAGTQGHECNLDIAIEPPACATGAVVADRVGAELEPDGLFQTHAMNPFIRGYEIGPGGAQAREQSFLLRAVRAPSARLQPIRSACIDPVSE